MPFVTKALGSYRVYDYRFLTPVIEGLTSNRTTFGYDDADQRTLKRLANGSRSSFTFDDAARLTRIVHLKSTNVTISAFDYQYDQTAHRTSVQEASGDRVTWTYDGAYQLLTEKRSGVHAYYVTHTYDAVGNRRIKDTGTRTTFAYDAANRLKYSEVGRATPNLSGREARSV